MFNFKEVNCDDAEVLKKKIEFLGCANAMECRVIRDTRAFLAAGLSQHMS